MNVHIWKGPAVMLLVLMTAGCATLGGLGAESDGASAADITQTLNSGAVNTGLGLGATAALWSGNADVLAKITEVQQLLQRVNSASATWASFSTATGGGQMAGVGNPVTQPLSNTNGKFLVPVRADGTAAEWTDKVMAAVAAGAATSLLTGRATDQAANQLASRVPIFGSMAAGFLSSRAKAKTQELGVIAAIGGWSAVREQSDRSFDNIDHLVVYMHTEYAGRSDYPQLIAATGALYPEFVERYETALQAHHGG